MTAPTALIADDEANLRSYLKHQLAQYWPELVICAEASNGQQALDALQKWQPDFAFLDIKMPAMTGIEVAKHVTGKTHIIFVTAYDQFAIEAFENAAVDYLLKPVSGERLNLTIERLKQRLNQLPPDLDSLFSQFSPTPQPHYLQWIKASRNGHIELIAVDEVDYFQSADKYTSVMTKEGEWIIRSTLKDLENELDPDKFWRIHRGTIVRVAVIEQFRKTFSGRNLLKLLGHEKPLAVSRSHVDQFKAD